LSRHVKNLGPDPKTANKFSFAVFMAFSVGSFLVLPFAGASAGEEEAVWEKRIEAGYDIARGNSEDQSIAARVYIKRNRPHVDEITINGGFCYSATDKETDTEKWDASARYAHSFGREKRFYNFYKTSIEHDRFIDIKYRLIPGAGIGYWLFDSPALKAMCEIGAAWEHTEYRSDTEATDEAVITPRAYLEKSVFKNSTFIEDIHLYPSVSDIGELRLHSETMLNNPISDNLSVNLKLTTDFDSDAPAGVEDFDITMTSSLSYSF